MDGRLGFGLFGKERERRKTPTISRFDWSFMKTWIGVGKQLRTVIINNIYVNVKLIFIVKMHGEELKRQLGSDKKVQAVSLIS